MSPKIIAWPAFINREGNPYNYLLYTSLMEAGVDVEEFSASKLLFSRVSLLHVHWPEGRLNNPSHLDALAKVYIEIALFQKVRSMGGKILWTVHNLAAHDQFYPRLERQFWSMFLKQVDGCLFLTRASQELAYSKYPQLKKKMSAVVPHGHYRGAYRDDVSRQDARRFLGLSAEATVLLTVGKIRRYKNIPHLLRVFKATGIENCLLVIAGAAQPESVGQEVSELAKENARVRLFLGHIPSDDLQYYLRACDMVILPYAEILNAGSAMLALSFDRPVIVPSLGSMEELKENAGSAWVRTYEGELTARELREAVHWGKERGRSKRAPLEMFDWERIAELTKKAYLELLVSQR